MCWCFVLFGVCMGIQNPCLGNGQPHLSQGWLRKLIVTLRNVIEKNPLRKL